MRKIADITICDTCLTIVDGDPAMGDGQTQTACAEAAPRLAENWPGYQVHSVGSESGEGSFSHADCDGCGQPESGTRYPAVVLAPEYTLTNVFNPAAFGVEWVAGQNGNRYQLVNARGTTTLSMGVQHKGDTTWHTTGVVDPSRFGLVTAPRTYAQFRTIADRYVNQD